MAFTRVWLLAAVLACMLLLVRSTTADDAAAPAGSAGLFGCNPLTDKTCRTGDPRAPENQEEEGGFGVRLPSVPLPTVPGTTGGVDRDGDGDVDDDDELPSFDTHLTILGH